MGTIKRIAKMGVVGAIVLGVGGVFLLKATIPMFKSALTPEELVVIEGDVENFQSGFDIAYAMDYPDSGELSDYLNFGDPKELLKDEDIKDKIDISKLTSSSYRFRLIGNPVIFRIKDFRFKRLLKDSIDQNSRVELGLSMDWENSDPLPLRYVKVNDKVILENKADNSGIIVVSAFSSILSLLLILSSFMIIIDSIKKRAE